MEDDVKPNIFENKSQNKKKARRSADTASQKRRCVSTACVACRKRKSKCDGASPSCAACASVYGTECIYDPGSDHRRKGVYREKSEGMKARESTLQILIEAILNAAEDDVPAIVNKIRTCDSLDNVAEEILKNGYVEDQDDDHDLARDDDYSADTPYQGERDLARKMGELRLENGSVRFIGGTSHLIYLGDPADIPDEPESDNLTLVTEDPITSWTEVTKDTQLIIHLINMYFNWHYPYFTTLSKSLFYRDFLKGKPRNQPRTTVYCSSLLVNAMLALGCHFTSVPGAFAVPGDSRTKGDHFFAEAKRLIVDNDEYEKPKLTNVQALALMSVREAGCGREAKGWVYSGMSFRMAQDIGLNLDDGGIAKNKDSLDEKEIDARRITFWGCFLFDKCWSNYLGRLPQIPKSSYSVQKYDVFPDEDAEMWSPYTDSGFDQTSQQASRIRAASLQLSKLCEISSDLLLFFYHPNHIGRSSGKHVELKKLSELHRRLECWKKDLPVEFEPKDGQLPNVILMHMFYHLQYIHLFRPFLKYTPQASPLPPHVSPRRICTSNAGAISKLMRLYKKMYNLRQICNIAVYMVHSACTIHLLNLPEKTAKRDITHGVKHLEEIAEDWLCARRTLSIISVLARKWNVDLPEEAELVLKRSDEKYGTFSTSDVPSPNRSVPSPQPSNSSHYSNSPPMHYMVPQQHPMTLEMSPTPDLLNGGLQTMHPQQQQQQMPKHITHPVSMGESLSWSLPPAVTQPMTSYSSPFNAPAPSGMPRVRHLGGTSNNNGVYMIDGQDWYLKDGVNWQQNFEAWNSPVNPRAGGGGGGEGVYMFQGAGPSRGGGSGGGGINEMDTSGFESLGSIGGSLDQYPGLD
ncbi:putative nitrogen assimilation transcription factor nit-4 [Podospora fimiseda]|uniref:Nitrogen assimilation transcription factor nit-4 n=1 Tax=Podospora fimiseda TaxID=252190 RepID=A0AAN7H7Y2_9PEZI|nr:putative nitrogen assimilation transcription factor nit-4 [Podospora fimiseda]